MKTSPLSPNVTVTKGTQTSPLSHRKGPSIQKGWQLVHRAIFCFFGQPRCLSYFQPLNYTSKTQRWPSPTTSNMYYLRVCRKPPQHSSPLLSSQPRTSPTVTHSLPPCTDTSHTPSPPCENQRCYTPFRAGAGPSAIP